MANKTKVTMLSGFLGAGKTTLLRHVLENSTEKIACIVNDVASINIDAKLVRNDRNRAAAAASKSGTGADHQPANSTADLADTIELQNGCACCSLQDELFASFEKVQAMADLRGEPYARILLENSGVAEPQNIREKFGEAITAGRPVMDRIELDTLVTVVDSATFIADYASRAPLASRPELGDGGNLRPVVDLLVEQIECADYVVLNKTDMLGDKDKLGQLCAIVASLNPLATVIDCERGKVPVDVVFGSTSHGVMARLNLEGQHRGAVAAAKALQADDRAEAEAEAHKHKHKHGGQEHKHDNHEHKLGGQAHEDHKHSGHAHEEHKHGGHAHEEHSREAHSHGEDGNEHGGCKAR